MSWILAFAAAVAVVVGSNFACAQIPSENRAVEAVENLGLTNVRVVSRQPAFENLLGCKSADVTKFKLVGTDARGVVRHIEVCAPVLLGGYTVRN